MKKVYISEDAGRPLKEYLIGCHYEVVTLHKTEEVYESIASHPDIYMCQINGSMVMSSGDLGYRYPDNIKYNGVQVGRYFLHNIRYTAPSLMDAVNTAGLIPVHVSQGYTKCNVVYVNEKSIITSDQGIADRLASLELEVLLIQPGHVKLKGFSHGFLGGASGRVGDTILFNGDLSRHPDFDAIAGFIALKGLALKYFTGYPLEDIGSILEESAEIGSIMEDSLKIKGSTP